MKKRGLDNADGFTIIEVALVLAIAGLIFMMIFIAAPALRRLARDATRQEDIYDVIKEIKNFQTNNRGALPSMPDSGVVTAIAGGDAAGSADSWQSFYNEYLKNKYVDPSGESYILNARKCGGDIADSACKSAPGLADMVNSNGLNYTMYIVTQAKCSGNEATGVVATSNPRKFAILYRMEGSGTFCANS